MVREVEKNKETSDTLEEDEDEENIYMDKETSSQDEMKNI